MIATKGTAATVVPAYPIGDIKPAAYNYRTKMDPAAIEGLADSIRQQGILQPILVRPIAKGKKVEIVAGHRRHAAALLAGLTEMPVVVRQLDDREAAELQAIENIQREDVHPLDECEAFYRLQELGHDVAAIASRIGKSERFVRGRLSLRQLVDPARRALSDDLITLSHASLLTPLPEQAQIEALDRIGIADRDGKVVVTAWDGRVGSVHDLRWHIRSRASQDLSKAQFDLDDGSLNPEMGSCQGCPHRQSSGLFEGLAKDGEDICTRPACYQIKVAAHVERRKAELEAEGSVLMVSSSYGNAPSGVISASSYWVDHSGQPREDSQVALLVDGPEAGKMVHIRLDTSRLPASAATDEEAAAGILRMKAEQREAARKRRAEMIARRRIFDCVLSLLTKEQVWEHWPRLLAALAAKSVTVNANSVGDTADPSNGRHPGRQAAYAELGIKGDHWEAPKSVPAAVKRVDELTALKAAFVAMTYDEIHVSQSMDREPIVLPIFADVAGVDQELIRRESDLETMSAKQRKAMEAGRSVTTL